MQQYVVYTRVSTEDQGRSGLGLEAQERDIAIFLDKFADVPFEVIERFQDVQSGTVDGRPALDKALAVVRRTGAELLVAKLDRLSRRVSFIAALMDDPKVRLRVAQMPNADKFQLHIYAALAEQERTFIKERTKAAIRAAMKRKEQAEKRVQAASAAGVEPNAEDVAVTKKRYGGLRDKTMKRNAAIQAKADTEAARVMKIAGPLRKAGHTLTTIADTLNDTGVATSRGGRWTAKQVSRVIERAS